MKAALPEKGGVTWNLKSDSLQLRFEELWNLLEYEKGAHFKTVQLSWFLSVQGTLGVTHNEEIHSVDKPTPVTLSTTHTLTELNTMHIQGGPPGCILHFVDIKFGVKL